MNAPKLFNLFLIMTGIILQLVVLRPLRAGAVVVSVFPHHLRRPASSTPRRDGYQRLSREELGQLPGLFNVDAVFPFLGSCAAT